MDKQETFFDFAAKIGITKHLGSFEATTKLLERCRIGEGQQVLDVGCGVGATPCFLARKCGCRVTGVDILPAMVERSEERARREGIRDRVDFKVADAHQLPFPDGLFDVVITESVTAFSDDKPRAMHELVRVAKLGGYVGLSEATWLKLPPPPELLAWASQDLGANIKPLTSSEWAGLLDSAGLREITAQLHTINVRNENKGMLRRYGWGGVLRIFYSVLLLYATSPAYRRFVKEVRENEITPANLEEYFGYGLYVGRK
jgi:arsenite methyltransferase